MSSKGRAVGGGPDSAPVSLLLKKWRMAFQAALNDDWGKRELLPQILAGCHKALDRFERFDCLISWGVDSQKAVHG